MVGVAHLEGCLGSLLPPPGRSRPALGLFDLDVPHHEDGTGQLGDRTNCVALVGCPAAEVEDNGRAAAKYLVGDPDHAPFEDVSPSVRFAVAEERRHPFVGRQAQDAVLVRDLTRYGRLA